MIPEIGILIATYIVFRALEAIVSTGAGGCHADLSFASRFLIGLLGVGVIAVAMIVGWDLWERGTQDFSRMLAGMPNP
ncbi:MAG TPA: hypothetical protein VNA25_30295 [Phycisphaerae bacterium]|nr:hypothetical protein [Phycisphaerae bacterium]